jgi:hypothetical protein
LTLNAGWETGLLKLEVADLTALGFDIPLMGFSADELSAMSMSAGLTDPDEVLDPLQPLPRSRGFADHARRRARHRRSRVDTLALEPNRPIRFKRNFTVIEGGKV